VRSHVVGAEDVVVRRDRTISAMEGGVKGGAEGGVRVGVEG